MVCQTIVMCELVDTSQKSHYHIIYWTKFNPNSTILMLRCSSITSLKCQTHPTQHGVIIDQRLNQHVRQRVCKFAHFCRSSVQVALYLFYIYYAHNRVLYDLTIQLACQLFTTGTDHQWGIQQLVLCPCVFPDPYLHNCWQEFLNLGHDDGL